LIIVPSGRRPPNGPALAPACPRRPARGRRGRLKGAGANPSSRVNTKPHKGQPTPSRSLRKTVCPKAPALAPSFLGSQWLTSRKGVGLVVLALVPNGRPVGRSLRTGPSPGEAACASLAQAPTRAIALSLSQVLPLRKGVVLALVPTGRRPQGPRP